MRRTLPLLAATMLALCSALPAQAVDGIGIYFEQGATNPPCRPLQAPSSTFRWYLVALNISATSGISGWECSLIYDGGSVSYEPVWTIQVVAGTAFVNTGSGLNFKVGLQQFLPYAPVMLLMRTGLISYDPDATGQPLKVGIGPAVPCSFGPGTAWPDLPPGPGYAQGNDPGQLHRLYPVSNGPAGPPYFYWVNTVGPTDCVTAEASSSWSDVKNLYK